MLEKTFVIQRQRVHLYFFLKRNGNFYLSQPEDYNLGDSLSESSENCSKEGKREASIYVILAKGYVKSSTHLGRMLLLFARNRYLS